MQWWLVAVSMTVYLLAALVWPTLRVWRRQGVWPVVFHRGAAPAQRMMGVVFALVLAGLPPALVGVALRGPGAMGVWPVPRALAGLGWLGILAGTAVTLAAQRQMDASWRIGIDNRPTALVTGGLFRYSRNPIFLGLGLFLAGVGCTVPAWWSLMGATLALAAIRVQVVWEERHLAQLHGRPYLDYAARVGRFVPGIGRLRPWAAPQRQKGK
jgi:protein-S-isoprenylcysteine O-methyltransferase Ste14